MEKKSEKEEVFQPRLLGEVGGLAASRIVGVKYRTLDSWVRTGLLPETTKPAQGKGTRRGFGIEDLVRARTVARLKAEGVSVQTIRTVLNALENLEEAEYPLLQGRRLIVADSKAYWAQDDADMVDILTSQAAFKPSLVLPMDEIAAEARQALLRATQRDE